MIRVLYVIDSMLFAGTQRHIAGMLRGHDTSRFRPYLLCLQKKGPLGEELEQEGYPVTAYGLKRIYAWQAMRTYPRYLSFLRREKIDVVHAYLFAAQVFAIPGARLAGVPLVIAGRRDTGKYWTEPRYARVRRVSNFLSHLQIANADAVKDFIVAGEKISPDKVRVVYNGVDAERFSPAASPAAGEEGRPLTIGYAGSLIRMKEVDVMLKASARVLGSCPAARVRIVGGGPSEELHRREGETDERLRSLAKKLGVGDRVQFVGSRAHVEEEMRMMDIFVFPSLLEGMSNAILEAMATGLPVIAADSGGNRELVREGETGYLFPPGDERRLAELMRDLLTNGEKRRSMGRAARERVLDRFTTRRMVEEMERVYLEELGKRTTNKKVCTSRSIS